MNKKYLLLFIGFLSILFLMSYKQSKKMIFDEIEYEDFILNMQEKKEPIVTGEISLDKIEKYKPINLPRRKIDKDEFVLLTQAKEDLVSDYTQHTREEIHQDVNVLFDLFENLYGGYLFFGGPEKFDKVKDKIIGRIDSDMSIDEMTNIIVDELSVFADGHMSVNGRYVYPSIETYMVKDFYVKKRGDKLFIKDEDGIFQIIDQEAWIQYLKPTIDDDGKLAYTFIKRISSEDKMNTSDQIKLLNNKNKEYSKKIQWEKLERYKLEDQATLSEKRKDGILIQKITKCYDDEIPNDELEKEFLAYGKRAFEENSMILDLRSNPGGYSNFPQQWAKVFLGDHRESKSYSVHTGNKLFKFHPYLKNNFDEETLEEHFDGRLELNSGKGRWIENDKIVLILSDEGICSAAEEFIFLLRQMEKSIIIGSSTGGYNLIGENFVYYLPNTGLSICFGINLIFNEKVSDDSESNIEPDLWVDPAEAEEKAILFMQYYQID